jgi:putative membrane protein
MNKDFKHALIIGGVFVAFIIIVSSVWGGFWGDGWGMMGGFGWGGLMGLGMVVFWGLVIWGIVLLVRGLTSAGGGESSRQDTSALEIIKRRYAKGEINKEEYEEKKKDLL